MTLALLELLMDTSLEIQDFALEAYWVKLTLKFTSSSKSSAPTEVVSKFEI